MENFLYKLIFPYCNKLYVGKAADLRRYGKNKPGNQFIGTHHNVEVQNLLDQGEFCYFHMIKEFETKEKVDQAEDAYLKKVWVTSDWTDRPKWLLNRNRNSVGGNLTHFWTDGGREILRQSCKKTKPGRFNKGNKRPDLAERNRQRKKKPVAPLHCSPSICEHCGKSFKQPGALTIHKRFKHL